MTSSARDILTDQHLTFNCYEFSRSVRAGRPNSRRWVSAEQCLCTDDPDKICDPTQLYSINIYEISDEELARQNKEIAERSPDLPRDRIGVLSPDDAHALIYVPPQFLDTLWDAALAADGVLRTISLSGQPQDKGHWAIFEITLQEEITELFELRFKGFKGLNPKISPPRADPAVVELRGLRAQLGWSGVAVIAVGVLIALWIARLWR